MNQPLTGLRVIDIATLFAGPLTAMLLGDWGADVLEIEHPKGDAARNHGLKKDGVSLWWTMFGRNKRAITLNLSTTEGQNIFRRLTLDADVVIENFRPGTLERWGIGYERLARDNPRLVLLRVTAFGQFGPYAQRPGFGTLAEAMSGFAAMTGEPGAPPTLPPFGLADGITGLAGAFAVMTALKARERTGHGQVIDLALIEPILTVLGAHPIEYDQLGTIATRTGSRSRINAPRNVYKTLDGRWLAISTSSDAIAARLMRLVGGNTFVEKPWFATASGRVQHVDELDHCVATWISQRRANDVIAAVEAAEAAVAPVYTIADIFTDPQYEALNSITTVQDPTLGPVRMQNMMFRMSDVDGAIRFTGRNLGADNLSVYVEQLGITPSELTDLRERGIV